MKVLLWVALLLIPAQAQAPALGSKAFFLQDPKTIIAACATKAESLEKDKEDLERIAEFGRAFLAAGLRKEAEDRFDRAEAILLTSEGEVVQLIGSGWLRSGYPREAHAQFESMVQMNIRDEEPYAKAACDLLRAGDPKQAVELMQKAWLLKPLDWEQLLEFAQVAAQTGLKETSAHWCQKALDAAPREALAWSRAARILADAERAMGITLAPWAVAPGPPSSGLPRPIWVVGSFSPEFSETSMFVQGTPRSAFGSAFPDQDRFTREVIAQITESLPGAQVLPQVKSIGDLPSMGGVLGTQLGERDVILAIERLRISDEKRSWSTNTLHFRVTRLRLAIYDRSGTLIRSHTLKGFSEKNSVKEEVESVRKAMEGFLRSPGFSRWVD